MRREHVTELMRALHCEKISQGTSWIRGTCPLARVRHAGARDRKPSFAVSVPLHGGRSFARCLACGYRGSLMELLWALDVERLAHFVQVHEEPEGNAPSLPERIRALPPYEGPPLSAAVAARPATLPEVDLQQFSVLPDHVMQHIFEKHRVTRETAEEWELGYHPEKQRIVIPIRNRDGALVALSGRYCGPREVNAKYLHSHFDRNLHLYGEHRVEHHRRGYLFEGFFVAIYAWQCGYRNVLARMGTHLSSQQEQKLVEYFSDLVIVPDGDSPGYTSARAIYERLRHRLPTKIAPVPMGAQLDELSPTQVREVLEEQLTTELSFDTLETGMR